jgi:hypothetical protein
MAIATAPSLTLSLNGDGNVSEYIRLPDGRCSVGIKLTGTISSAVGTVGFAPCVSSSDSSPDQKTSPLVSVNAANVDDYVELSDVVGDYLVMVWNQTTGEAVNVSGVFTIKEW